MLTLIRQDPGLLDRLVTEKLNCEAEIILIGEQRPLTEDEIAAHDALRSELDKLEESYCQTEDIPEEVDRRLAEIESALVAFEERPVVYDPHEIARAGTFVSIDGSGALRVERGYVRAEDEPAVAPDLSRQNQTAGALANELREASAAKPDLFSAAAARFTPLRPLFIRHFFDGLRQTTQQNAAIDWTECLALVRAVLERSRDNHAVLVSVPGDDPDWSWALKAMIDWLSAALARGAEGIVFAHYANVRALVLAFASRINLLPGSAEEEVPRGSHPYLSARQTLFGSMIELSILLLFWSSKDAGNVIGKAPREALAHDGELRSILDNALAREGTAGRAGRAILGRYLSWLFYFGESWLREHIAALFPRADEVLWKAAWVAHIQYDQHPVADLTDSLCDLYSKHIAVIGGDDGSFGGATAEIASWITWWSSTYGKNCRRSCWSNFGSGCRRRSCVMRCGLSAAI